MENTASSNLFSWFEKSGILSNVRAHLRQNLINALKSRDLDLKRDSAPKSAKQYIYDLLIAEYLFNHNYSYTLSVFASEAPMLVNFPTNQSAEENQSKLQEDYVLHALETLGINPQSSKGRYIVSQYICQDAPLLLCILKSLSMSFAIRTNVEEDKLVCDKHAQTEDPRWVYSEDEAKLIAMKKGIVQQKKVFDNELKRREAALKEQAVIMDQQLRQLDEKFDEVQTVMRAISLKEKELNDRRQNEENTLQKHLELTCREKQLLVEANRRFEEDLLKLQDQLSRVQKELPTRKVSIVKTTEVQTESIIDAGKELQIASLTKEKEELNKLVKDQQLRIEQITQRALQLSRQVEDIHLLRPSETETPIKATTTVISETSSTEDILQDAKSRLRRLEEESLKADQYYYKFINATS